jgi:excisionase family DNA binding protein
MQAVTITQITYHELEIMIDESLKKIMKKHFGQISLPPEEEFLTIQQVAKLIHLTVPSIYGLVHRRQIPYMKQGKRLYFSKDEITAWLKSGKKNFYNQ